MSHVPATAVEIANEFISLSLREKTLAPILDRLKLQALLYYAAGWYLTWKDHPLFEENILARPWGPVVTNVYLQTVDHVDHPIVRKLHHFVAKDDECGIVVDWVTPHGAPEEVKKIILKVWDSHKEFTGIQLMNSTHAEGEPWHIISQHFNVEESPSIPTYLIRDVFRKKIKKDG